MKSSLFTMIASSLFIQCGASDTISNPAETVDTESHENYTLSDLEGHWTLINVETLVEKQSIARFKADGGDPEILTEWSPPVYLNQDSILVSSSYDFYSISNSDLVISGDSLFWIDYPFELKKRSHYTLKTDLLEIENDPDINQVVLSPNRDTLQISFLDDYGLYVHQTYQKVTFNDSILTVLKRDTINLPLLAGTWEIIRAAGDDYGEEYTLYFPYEIPDSVAITKDELISIVYDNGTYAMMTDGKKRNYSLVYYDRELLLSPYNWNYPDDRPSDFNLENAYIRLNRLSKERPKISPQECWAEFLQVITSGDKHGTIDLMTLEGYNDMRNNVDPLKMELTLKQRGQLWQDWEIRWGKISKTHATATFGPENEEKHLEFVRINGMWLINALKEGEN